MWKIVDYLNATRKVAYDKTMDYAMYYMGYAGEEVHDESNDSVENYKDLLKIEEFTDETTNSRIYPEVGYYDEYTTFFSYPTYICDNIYLGSAFNAASYDTLQELDIKVVLNITKEITNHYPDDITYLRYDIYDNNKHSIEKHLEESYQDIKHHQENTEGNILVHCYMGRSRSVSVILYYLMMTKKKDNGDSFTFDDAMKFVKDKRPIINPTFRFTKDLARSFIK